MAMKFTTDWLSDFVSVGNSDADLGETLTMSGLEVEGIERITLNYERIVSGRLVEIERVSDSEHLSYCKVDAGELGVHWVVCGAANVRTGFVGVLALPGARLPDGRLIEQTRIKGYVSGGMLCSALELGLGEDHSGILELPGDVDTGAALDSLVRTEDSVFDVNLTPNRGDCLSMLGVAREIHALGAGEFHFDGVSIVPSRVQSTISIELCAPTGCPRYVGRIIEDVDLAKPTPLWMRERLRRCGIRSINPVVDVTNYVMLALGQPMHAFDHDRIVGGIRVRHAVAGEVLRLLDDSIAQLDSSVLVIADHEKPVALAGIMGGSDSGVHARTKRVLLESAYFDPVQIAETARNRSIHTDASHRFERGVDPREQERAVELATALIVELCGGRPGPVCLTQSPEHVPPTREIAFRLSRANSLLGMDITQEIADRHFRRLGLQVDVGDPARWSVRIPSFRSDIHREVDLVEELVRLHGYSTIPTTRPRTEMEIRVDSASSRVRDRLREQLVASGYFEAITYSFIREDHYALFGDVRNAIALTNPISREMAVMRPSLCPGLVAALIYNQNRQLGSVRLFELGMVFSQESGVLNQATRLGGIAVGHAVAEQWGIAARTLDFFDVKQDVENLLTVAGLPRVNFVRVSIPGLHPGESAVIESDGARCGYIGKLHPKVLKTLNVQGDPVVFELTLAELSRAVTPAFRPFSKFPSVRRDVAVVIPESVTASEVQACVSRAGAPLLRDFQLFDVYRGQGIDSDKKSMALGLIFQTSSSTLTDNQVDVAVGKIVELLASELGGSLRV